MPAPASIAAPLRLILLLALCHASFSGTRLALSLTALHLQASAVVVGVLMSLLMVLATFISVPVGRWADRAGYLRPTLVGLVTMLLGLACAALLPTLAGLAITAVLVGTGFTFLHVAINNAIGHLAGASGRTRAFGLMALGFSLSGLGGPLLAGIAIDELGHRWAFGVLLLIPLLAAGPLLHGAPPSAPPEVHERVRAGGVLDLLRLPSLRAVLLVSAALSAAWDLFTFLVPLHGTRHALSATAIGLVIGAFAIGSALIRLGLPWIARRLSVWRLLGGALLLAAGGYFVMPFCTTVGTMVPLAFALGVVLGCGQPLVMSLLHQAAPAGRSGEAVGLRGAITSLGQMTLPLLFGAFGAVLGLLPMFWVAAAVVGAGGSYALRQRPAPR